MNTSTVQNHLLRQLNAIGLLVITIILTFALYDQFADHDLPCPLCLLQRIGFTACIFAILLNILYGPKPWHYALILISSIFGAAVALRQVSLHVIPGTSSYGDALLGLHFYTWAFMAFSAIILLTSLFLLISTQFAEKQLFIPYSSQPPWIKIIIFIALAIIIINAISAVVECGLGVCADNPTTYKLLQQ